MNIELDSISEENGLKQLSSHDKKIYSVGISTGGRAEIRMARDDVTRHVTATTIDLKGAEFARRKIERSGFSRQILILIQKGFALTLKEQRLVRGRIILLKCWL